MKTFSQIATSSSGAKVKMKGDTNCRTLSVVYMYLIPCGKCGKQYFVETKGPLNIRMDGHRDDCRQKIYVRYPVGQHFYVSDHDFIGNTSVCCESYWIRRLNSLKTSGINKKEINLQTCFSLPVNGHKASLPNPRST